MPPDTDQSDSNEKALRQQLLEAVCRDLENFPNVRFVFELFSSEGAPCVQEMHALFKVSEHVSASGVPHNY